MPPVTSHGIEIKLHEVLIENDRVHLSVTVKSDLIRDLYTLQLGHIENGLRIGLIDAFDLSGSSWSSAAFERFPDGERDGSVQIVLTAVVPATYLTDDQVPMRLDIMKMHVPVEGELMGADLYGLWSFDFTADLTKAKELTRRIALDAPFFGDGTLYKALELTVSPLYARIAMERAITEEELDDENSSMYADMGNFLGYIVTDEHGNSVDLTNPDYQNPSEKSTAVIRRDYFSYSGNNGWDWLRDADVLTVTPVMATLAGPLNPEATGIAAYKTLEPIQVKTDPEPSQLEKFMAGFEPDYQVFGDLDTRNPYVKPLRMMKTTKNGLTIMLDKVLVTEADLYISVLMGIEGHNGTTVTPSDFQIDLYEIDISPVLPYPPDYFEVKLGGGGGGGPYINVIHEDPLIVYDGFGQGLMYSDGYVSPKDPMQVSVKILRSHVCWDYEYASNYSTSACFTETEPLTFEFETDGAELAALTTEIELNTAIPLAEGEVVLNRLRFNPMSLILFTDDFDPPWRSTSERFLAYAETDDGTRLLLNTRMYPFAGFSLKTVKPDEIAALEETERLKIGMCLPDPEKAVEGQFYMGLEDKICDPAWSTTVDLNR